MAQQARPRLRDRAFLGKPGTLTGFQKNPPQPCAAQKSGERNWTSLISGFDLGRIFPGFNNAAAFGGASSRGFAGDQDTFLRQSTAGSYFC
jgi:hypothetical protein